MFTVHGNAQRAPISLEMTQVRAWNELDGMSKGCLLKLTRVLFWGAAIFFWLAALCSQVAATGSQAASPGANASPAANSPRLPERCWSPQELQGTPENRRSHKDPSDNRRDPPARVVPQTLLPPLDPALQGSIRSVEPAQHQKVIALTFDLCETTAEVSGYDAEIVNYLRTRQVKATFYAGGKWMRSHPARTQQLMTDPLFELGNHSWSHANFRKLTASQMEQQILWTQAQYELLREDLHRKACMQEAGTDELQRAPRTPLTFRFPYGTCTPLALRVAAGCGLPAIQWSVVSGDPAKQQSAARIASRIGEQVRPGAIIICHANGRGTNTAQALPLFIPQLQARGYRFVTVSELLAAGRPVAADTCFEVRAGDNLRYDRLPGNEGR
jgi:peptidoglycan/xylan/chitin deacetylase (PgdA/CDA1 family)